MATNADLVDYLMPISTRYVFGGSRFDPCDTDCSGMVDAAFWHVLGVWPYTLGTYTGDIWASDATAEIWRGTTPNLPWDIMHKGDIILSGYTSPEFNTGKGSHVGLYTGDPSAPFLSHFCNGGPLVTGMTGVYGGKECYFGVKRYLEGDIDMTPEQAQQLQFIYDHLHWRESDHYSDLGNLVAEFPVEYETWEGGKREPLTQPLGKRIGFIDQRIHVIEENQAAIMEALEEIRDAIDMTR